MVCGFGCVKDVEGGEERSRLRGRRPRNGTPQQPDPRGGNSKRKQVTATSPWGTPKTVSVNSLLGTMKTPIKNGAEIDTVLDFIYMELRNILTNNIQGTTGFEPLNLLLVIAVFNLNGFTASIGMIQNQL